MCWGFIRETVVVLKIETHWAWFINMFFAGKSEFFWAFAAARMETSTSILSQGASFSGRFFSKSSLEIQWEKILVFPGELGRSLTKILSKISCEVEFLFPFNLLYTNKNWSLNRNNVPCYNKSYESYWHSHNIFHDHACCIYTKTFFQHI